MRQPDEVRDQEKSRRARRAKRDLTARKRKTFLKNRTRVVSDVLARLAPVRYIVRRVDDELFLRNLEDVSALWTRSLLTRKPIVDLEGRHAPRAYNANRHSFTHSQKN